MIESETVPEKLLEHTQTYVVERNR